MVVSVTQSCLTLCDPMDCSMPSLPVSHHHQKFAQVHVHCISDAVQPSHPLMPSSPSALNLSQHQGPSNESSVRIRWPKYWSFNFSFSPSSEYSGLISLKIDWFDLLVVQRTSRSPLQHHSSKASILWRSAFFTVQLCLQPYVTTEKTIALIIRTFVGRIMSLLFNTCLGLSSLSCQEATVFWFHGCSHCPQWFWSQRRGSLSLLPPFPPSICHEVMGLDAMILVF